jgi:hypothetical protein
VLTAVMFYAQSLGSVFVRTETIAAAYLILFHQVNSALGLLLSLIGAVITLRGASGVVRGGADAS